MFLKKWTWHLCQLALVKDLRIADTRPLWASEMMSSVPCRRGSFKVVKEDGPCVITFFILDHEGQWFTITHLLLPDSQYYGQLLEKHRWSSRTFYVENISHQIRIIRTWRVNWFLPFLGPSGSILFSQAQKQKIFDTDLSTELFNNLWNFTCPKTPEHTSQALKRKQCLCHFGW